jgi:tetratricopeptide (TPR) repeat protein
LRDALYDELGPADQSRLHLQVATALEQLGGRNDRARAAELAHHFFQAAHIGGARNAVRYAELAGVDAAERLAFEEMPDHYIRALAALDLCGDVQPQDRCRIMIALGQAQLRAQDRERGRATLASAAELARENDLAEDLARIALCLAPGTLALEVGVYDPLLVRLLEEAIARCGPRNPQLHAQLQARLALALVWADEERRRRQLTRNALHTARSTGDPTTLALALIARHSVLGGPEHLQERLGIVEEIGPLAAESGLAELLLMHRVLKVTGLLELGNFEHLDQEIDRFSQDVHQGRHPYLVWYLDLFNAMRALLAGDFLRAQHLSNEFHEQGMRFQDQNASQSFATHRILYLWESGRPKEAASIIEQFTIRFPAVIGWRATLALFRLESGDLDEARRAFNRIARQDFRDIPHNELWTTTVVILSQICAAVGDRERADLLYEMLSAGVDQFSSIGFAVASFGSIARYLGLLAAAQEQWTTAFEHYERALELNTAAGAWPWVVRTQRDYARALMVTGDAAKALDLENQALHICQRLGLEQRRREQE